jgi:hypothetical protein
VAKGAANLAPVWTIGVIRDYIARFAKSGRTPTPRKKSRRVAAAIVRLSSRDYRRSTVT